MDNTFEQFWDAYPRKQGKGKAREKFAEAIRKTTLDVMLTAIAWQRFAPQWTKDGGQYIPLPATWLHQERWDDQPSVQPLVKERTAKNIEAARRWANG